MTSSVAGSASDIYQYTACAPQDANGNALSGETSQLDVNAADYAGENELQCAYVNDYSFSCIYDPSEYFPFYSERRH